jgi:hypothetical protein
MSLGPNVKLREKAPLFMTIIPPSQGIKNLYGPQ